MINRFDWTMILPLVVCIMGSLGWQEYDYVFYRGAFFFYLGLSISVRFEK
jgi:hypothetical protein